MDKDSTHSTDFITNFSNGKSGFTTPQNYFEQVEDDFFAKLTTEHLPKKDGFKVSDTYFNNLEEQIIAKISTPKKEVPVISIKNNIRRLAPLVAAASLLLFISINYFTAKTININDISANDIENWLANENWNTDNTEFTLALETSDFDENEFLNSPMNDIEIEDYLNNVETATLLNEIQ